MPNLFTIMDLQSDTPTESASFMINNSASATTATRCTLAQVKTLFGIPAVFPTPDNVTIVEGSDGTTTCQKVQANNNVNVGFWIGTVAEYGEIQTKDANTLYIVKQTDNVSCSLYLGELQIL